MSEPARGAVLRISSLANPQIKAIRGLSQRKHRRESGSFLAEGLKLVLDGLEAGWSITTFVYSGSVAGQDRVAQAAARARAAGAVVLEVTEQIMEKIARRDNPQMVIGVFRQRLAGLSTLLAAPDGLWLALEGIRDPGNLGTIVRTAEAAGADGIVLVGDVTDPFGLEAVRASMGSLFHVPLARISRSGFLEARRNWPGRIIGTHLAGRTDFRRVAKTRPLTILMGNEQSGLPEDLARLCDELVVIPMRGKADSLNLAVATGVVLFELALPEC